MITAAIAVRSLSRQLSWQSQQPSQFTAGVMATIDPESRAPPLREAARRRRTSNVHLQSAISSDRHETSATRVSEDLQFSIFRCRKILSGNMFGLKNLFFVNLVRFWRIYSRSDVKIRFGINFFFPDKDFLRCVRPQIMKI